MKEIAIVIGGNHHNTLGLIRGLGRKGIKSSLILQCQNESNYVLKSKYLIDSTIVKNEEELVKALQSKQSGNKQVVICTSDGAASIIDRHRDILKDYFFLPGCEEQNRLTEIMNKATMSELAVQSGLRIPRSVVINNTEINLSGIPYPCITKPISSIEEAKQILQFAIMKAN